MSTPPEHPQAAPTDAPAGTMVRLCDRCGTVCSADQEWCLSCGVRMTPADQRLPGLRAASLVVALAVLLAGGAAAASYAALRGDARSAANVPSTTTTAPVAAVPAPAPVPPAPVAPTAPAPTAPAPKAPAKKGATAPATPAPKAGGSAAAATAGGAAAATSTGGSTSGTSRSSGSAATTSGTRATTTTTRTAEESGPVVFAAGQGTIYDPDGIAKDRGEEGNAIDGSTRTSWSVELVGGRTGGLGYVLDFDDPTALRALRVTTADAGMRIKVLGTTQSALPPDELDSNWDTVASERTLRDGTTSVPLKAVSGAKSKYRHVLVLFTSVPGTPAKVVVREFVAVR